jgi:hypothetical protein
MHGGARRGLLVLLTLAGLAGITPAGAVEGPPPSGPRAAAPKTGPQQVSTGGTLTVTEPLASDFAPRAVTGVEQTTSATLGAFTVADLRLSGAGWRVVALATPFTGNGRALPAGSLTMSAPSVTPVGTLSPAPTVLPGPLVLDAGGATLAQAGAGEGAGTYVFSASTLTLRLPGHVHAGTYSSTITISVESGP